MSGFFDGVGNILSDFGSQIRSMGIIDYILTKVVNENSQ